MSSPASPAGVAAPAPSLVSAYLELAKPRVVAMVVVTTFAGFYLAGGGLAGGGWRLLHLLLGTGLAAGGTLALNEYLERDLDAVMRRTRNRPLPAGRLRPEEALAFGVIVTALGLVHLTLAVGAAPAAVTATITATYLFLYTPLKRRTALCSLVGAVPGALPPVAGWVAARGDLGIGAWILFAILFLWQLPHSLAIARLYREDYARAGIRLLPVVDPDGPSTGRHIVLTSLGLLAVALLPSVVGLAGGLYFACAMLGGTAMLAASLRLARSGSVPDARRLLWVSLLYVPIVLGAMGVDRL